MGVVAEWRRWRLTGADWLADLAVGVGLAVAGAMMQAVDRRSRVGDLVALAGVAWFLPDVFGLGGAALTWLSIHSLVLHRAVLFQAIVAFPSGRVARPLDAVVVGTAYATSLSDLSRDVAGEIVWATAAMVAFIAIVRLRSGPARDAGIRVIPTMALLCLVIGGTGGLLLLFGSAPPPPATIHAYEAGVVAVGFALLLNVVDHRARLRRMTDAAVELTLGPAGYVAGVPGECAARPDRRGRLRRQRQWSRPLGGRSSGAASNPFGLPDRGRSCRSWWRDAPLLSSPASRLSLPSRA